MKQIGLIQSRGLGDICIALPIAHYYHQQGYEVFWPICREFYPSFKDHAPWVKWIPIETDPVGHFFYDVPMAEFAKLGIDEIICLYQSLNVRPELSDVPWFQLQKFDEFKYTRAGVPFKNKWTLDNCLRRNLDVERKLFDSLVKNDNYYVTHLEGSTFKASPDLSAIPADWQRINIDNLTTPSIFDWLTIIENANALICIDSIISNMVDQLDLKVDKYWIPRSHIQLTPVLGSNWTILDVPDGSLASQKIFVSSADAAKMK